MSARFGDGKPPKVSLLDRLVCSHGVGVEGPFVVADFAGNPEAAGPFYTWVKSGEAWAAFGSWHDAQLPRRAHGRNVPEEQGK